MSWCEPIRIVADAVRKWDAMDLEAAIDEARARAPGAHQRGMDGAPHGQTLAAKPIVEIIKIGDSDPELPETDRSRWSAGVGLDPYSAGPIAARTLAEHGADVLMVTTEGLPQIPQHVIDTSHGKRSYLDLKDADCAATLKELVKSADVPQGYRPGIMQKFGFGPEDLADHRPGIVYVSTAGADGLFSHRADGNKSRRRSPALP